MADAHFEDPVLVALYDALDADRSDLDVYADLVVELGARSVLDVGCGTGTFACLLARRGISVTAVDPAAASLDIARRKPEAASVRWVLGGVTALPPTQVDLVTMTGNVAQVFLSDSEWSTALAQVRGALRPGGWFVFETRDPDAQAWRGWNRHDSTVRAVVPGIGGVEHWVEVTDVSGDLVSFRGTYLFERDGTARVSESTLRFRSRAEVAASLADAGLELRAVRDAPDRPGRELVFLAQRPS